MKTKNIIIILLILSGFAGQSQVKDISVTFSPAAEFTWWDNQAGLNDGVLVGGKIGFGFGEFMELRGVYLQSYDLSTNFENFGLPGYNSGLFNAQDVNLTRYGGEFKANIGTGKLKPYLTLGTGIQNIEITDNGKFEHIYASAGLGLKVNLFPRAVLLLEGKNTSYNFDAVSNLLTSNDKTNFGITEGDYSRERLSNWAVQGALQFYLGGRKPGVMTELDKAYLNKFRSGLRGIQFIVEPGLSHIAFDENSLYRDTWFAGGYAGLDFNEYIGLRGFYFNAVEDLALTSNFDNLSMYGMELRARLNDGSGVTSFLTLGGGYLDPSDNYLGKNGLIVKGGEFASGGFGLNIPLGKRVLLNGGVRAMISSSEDIVDIASPGDLQTHMMYNAGVKFTMGRKAKSTELIYEENVSRDVDNRMAANDLKMQQMKIDYQNNIMALEEELSKAYEANDAEKAAEIMEEKIEIQKSFVAVEKLEKLKAEELENAKELESSSKIENAKEIETVPVAPQVIVKEPIAPRQNIIRMSPAELESLIVNILKTIQESPKIKPTITKQDTLGTSFLYEEKVDLLNERIGLLEKLLLEIKEQNKTVTPKESSDNSVYDNRVKDNTRIIMEKLEDLDRKIERNSVRINDDGGRAQTIVVTPFENNENDKDAYITAVDEDGKIINNETISDYETDEQKLFYTSSSAMFGFNFGGAPTTNLGIRMHFDIINSPLQFMPEIYYGLGDSNSFGISGNVIYPISIKSDKVMPYAGIGLGIGRIDSNLRGNYNVILGARLPFVNENLSLDYTMRNSFDYNQLAVSYRLPF